MLSAAVAEGASQHELAHAVGKDPSWVNRRLALLTQLGEPLQEAVRSGVLSSWAASRILAPLARACPHRRRDSPGLPATRAAVDARAQRLVSALSPGQSHGARAPSGPTAVVYSGQRECQPPKKHRPRGAVPRSPRADPPGTAGADAQPPRMT
ncbi:hypothetical protein [Thiorhodovibrio winogradskyi]